MNCIAKEKLLSVISLTAFLIKMVSSTLLFHKSMQTFATFDTDLTPIGSPFLLCKMSMVLPYTLICAIYCVLSTFQNKPGGMTLETNFYICFSFSCIFEAACAIVWAHSWIVPAFILNCSSLLCQAAALYQAFTRMYYAKNTVDLRTSTLWFNRIFIQSSLIFDFAWNSVLAILVLAVVLFKNIGISPFQASAVALAIFAIGLLTWFLIQNFVIEKFVRFTGAEYIAISIAITSLLPSDKISASIFQSLLFLLTMVVMLLFLRLFSIMYLERRRKVRSEVYFLAQI